MLVGNKIAGPNLSAMRERARSGGLGDLLNDLTDQIQTQQNYIAYITNQYNVDHFGGQTPEQFQEILSRETGKLQGLYQQLQAAQAAAATSQAASQAVQAKQATAANTSSQIQMNTDLLTPSGPGVVISAAGPSQAQILRSQLDNMPRLSEPTSYAQPVAPSLFSQIPIWGYLLAAFAAYEWGKS